jgi:hypothetical protein
MKKKLLTLTILSFTIFGFTALNADTVKAAETTGTAVGGTTAEVTSEGTAGTEVQEALPVTYISITRLPAKLTYAKGDNLDLTGMVVQGYYADGTNSEITGYEVIGYNSSQIGSQTVIVYYQNQIAAFTVNVIPGKVTNVTVADHNTASYTLTWDARQGVTRYEVYLLDELTGAYNLTSLVYTNSITFYDDPGKVHTYKISAVENLLGVEYRSDFSDACVAGTNPGAVSDVTVTGTTTNSVSLSWTAAEGATGYFIYRSPASGGSFELCGTSDTAAYTDKGLKSGESYQYKVCAYAYNDTFTGYSSPAADTSTNPAKVSLKYKAGEQKVRFSWSKVNGATSYEIYADDGINGITTLFTSMGNNGATYIAEGLVTGNTYKFYAVAHREYNGAVYDSPASDLITIQMQAIAPTSTEAKLFPTEKDFLNSWSYNNVPFFSKYVDYSRSYIIPGLITTNVGGFASKDMCPQGLTFAGKYLLMSAYDIKAEENSVIYVMDKATKELLTTLILPSKPHAGGLCYDGFNVWVTDGSKVSSILYSDIAAAASSGMPYVYVNYNTVNPLGITTSFAAYYDNKLWVGTYNELQTTKMYSYTISNKKTSPVLTKTDTIIMPTRVQGIAFTSVGTLILSRSCQLYYGLRGYMRQIDIYRPDYSKTVDGVIQLGNLVSSVSMPSMNEGIAISGNYLYVTFESGAFEKSTYKMDRISAFKLSDLVRKNP